MASEPDPTRPDPTTSRQSRLKRARPDRTCHECGGQFEPRVTDQQFCCKAHKQEYHNRQISRGNKLFPLVYRWRALRTTRPDASNAAFSRMCALLSGWIDDDRAAGRAIPAIPESIGIASAVVYRPTTSQKEIERADREMNANHNRFKARTGLK